jgi:hypothetical protein
MTLIWSRGLYCTEQLCASWKLGTFNLHATHATHHDLHLVQTDIICFQLGHLLAQRFVYSDCTQALSCNGTVEVGALGGCTVS